MLYFLSRILIAWFVFLLPSYSTFKVLSHHTLSESELQRWSMYWAVIGAFVAFQYIAEWLISWLPFYWEIKTLFLLFLSLPQTQGSAFVYNTYLQPFFFRNEADLDAGILSIQRNTLTFLNTRLYTLWEFAWSIINKTPVIKKHDPSDTSQSPAISSLPISWQSLTGLWQTYGSSMMNTAGIYAARPGATRASPSTGSFQDTTQLGSPYPPETGTNPLESLSAHSTSQATLPFPEPHHF